MQQTGDTNFAMVKLKIQHLRMAAGYVYLQVPWLAGHDEHSLVDNRPTSDEKLEKGVLFGGCKGTDSTK